MVRVAGPPLVERPLFATFDDAGRLYVLDSGGVNGDDRQAKPPDVLRVLEDLDGDGIFDRSTLCADQIVFGTGLAWHGGSLYVTSPPSLWKFTDRDGDLRIDERQELVTGFAFNQSCSDDLHGACVGPDGRIYFLPGRFGHRIHAPGGPVLREGIGPWLMRCRPDGTDIELVSGAVGNPVEVDFLPNGDAFLQGTYWAKPSFGGGLRDAVVHAVEGGEYSVRDRDYTDRIRTGPLLPALVPMTATAPSGCVIYRGDAFGPSFEGNLFGAYFNTGSILRHRLRPAGSSYSAETEPFLRAVQPDVHFTDVLEDADGSLLAIDTGGWFRRCCPTSQIAKPEIAGGIYRVRRVASADDRVTTEILADPRGLRLEWTRATNSELVERLDDPRFIVRQRAADALAQHGDAAVEALAVLFSPAAETSPDEVATAHSPRQRLAATWVLARLDVPAARSRTLLATHDPDAHVRQAAVAGIALHRDATAAEALCALLLHDPSPGVRREAANALGRIGDAKAVPALLAAAARGANTDAQTHGDDPFLEHALVLALIRIGDSRATREGLASASESSRRAALLALDQLPGDPLRSDDLRAALTSNSPRLRDDCLPILRRHPAWAAEFTDLFAAWLRIPQLPSSQITFLRETVRAARDQPALIDWITNQLSDPDDLSSQGLVTLLQAASSSGLEQVPPQWTTALGRLASHANDEVALAAIQAIAALRLEREETTLRALAAVEETAPVRRVAALHALAAMKKPVSAAEFSTLLELLQGSPPLPVRLSALETVALLQPNRQQLLQVVPMLREAGPVDAPALLRVFASNADEAVGLALVEALRESTLPWSLDLLQTAFSRYPETVQQAAEPLMRRAQEEAAQRADRLAKHEQSIAAAAACNASSAERGHALFFGKANCHLCHRLQGEGGQVGPDLTGIGSLRSRRDLLEAIVYPSASFARGFEPVNVTLEDGRLIQGLMGREAGDEVILVTVEGNRPREIPVPRTAIDDFEVGRVSVMPEGLERQLSESEFADLVAFLETQRSQDANSQQPPRDATR